jgi:uncharacterized protein YhfF
VGLYLILITYNNIVTFNSKKDQILSYFLLFLILTGKKRFEHGYKSEYDLVKDFMLKSSRYPSVLDGEQGKPSVVLVEDVPLTFFRDPGALHDLLW